ncbi:MAG TPA: carotenoid biosynthesis protein [Bacteroidales bacterium]|nr:carotenoid biosynthesis protein [Bacteroidales bacterium]
MTERIHTKTIRSRVIPLFIIFYLVGLLIHLTPALNRFAGLTTLPVLLISNIVVLLFLPGQVSRNRLILWLVVAYLVTFLVEVTGVHTGNVFGSYQYGAMLGFSLFGVPLIIAFNWIILILATYDMAGLMTKGRLFQPLLAALLIVVFDVIMEPVAMKLDYWHWQGGVIPLQNYMAWFFIALAFSFWLKFMKINLNSILLRAYLLIQAGFFLVLNIF